MLNTLAAFLLFLAGCASEGNSLNKLKVSKENCPVNLRRFVERTDPIAGFVTITGSEGKSSIVSLDMEKRNIVWQNFGPDSELHLIDIGKYVVRKEDQQLYVTHEGNSFYIFDIEADSVLALDIDPADYRIISSAQKHIPFLTAFLDTAYISFSTGPVISMFDNSMIIPYRLYEAENDNLLGVHQYVLVENAFTALPGVTAIGSYQSAFYKEYDPLVRHVKCFDEERKVLYFTNRKESNIYRYAVKTGKLDTLKIPASGQKQGMNYENKNEDNNYEREYLAANNVNYKILIGTEEGQIYLIRKLASPENDRKFEVLLFDHNQCISSAIIHSNTLLVDLAFIHEKSIYIPDMGANNYYVINQL